MSGSGKHFLEGYERDEHSKKQKKHHDSSKSDDPSSKVAKLLKALDRVLKEDGIDEIETIIGQETIQNCRNLQNSLRSATPSAPAPASPAPKARDGPNIPKSFSPTSITPWKSSEISNELPALPRILDPTLERAAFTHVGTGHGNITDLSYERLEWVGDIYLELTATLLISQTFPHFMPGKASQMRESLVRNLTLASYARAYGFDKRAHLGQKPEKGMEKVLGDMFEAYVAAVILSDPENGLGRAVEWLKALWGRDLKKKIREEEQSGSKFINPMWRLVGEARDAQEALKKQVAPLNPKEQLQKLLGMKGIKIEYKDIGEPSKDKTNKLALFTVGVYLNGYGETGKLLGTGSANGKKEAGARAADEAMKNKKLMTGLLAKKKVKEEQLELERQALAAVEGA